ncbi:hypothetical protein CDD83_1268 [Cordyceps sp. RAO-2017]|nr:hypothetical protein CDD83_1268 [Cordyceps sp. RAO-2017]
MADGRLAVEALRSTDATPIAKLHPDIENSQSRAVDGVVTITWPYSVVKESIAFVLAERDFRLRRQSGQLRVEFRGPAAKALVDLRVGGGDEVRLSLDGATWDGDQAPTQLPAGALEWQLSFSNRLLLILRRADGQGSDAIDIHAPNDEDAQAHEQLESSTDKRTPPPPDPPQVVASPNDDVPPSLAAKRQASSMLGPDEFASPAFIKRARVSYGSLFEGGLDIFDEERGRETRDRKKRRSRFSMPGTSWKYSSRSPSPEASRSPSHGSVAADEARKRPEQEAASDAPKTSPHRPVMVDEACQTHDEFFSPSHVDVYVSAEARFSGSAMRPTSASAPPEAHHQLGHDTLQTPSRMLFDRGSEQHVLTRSAVEPSMGYETTFAFGTEQHHEPAHLLSAPSMSNPAMSSASFSSQAMSAPDYHLATFGGHPSPSSALNIDPGLQFPNEMHAPDHLYYGGPVPEDATWNPGPLPPAEPPISVQDGMHRPGVLADGSLVRGAASGAHPGPEDSERSVPARPPSRQNGRPESGGSVERAEEAASAAAAAADQDDVDGEDDDAEDIPGEDYDLRNYDRARDDDDEEDSEEESEPDSSDVERRAIDFSEEDSQDEQERDEPDLELDGEARRDEGSSDSLNDSRDDDDDDGAEYASSDGEDELSAGAEHFDGYRGHYEASRDYDEDDEDGYFERREFGDEGEESEEDDDGFGPTSVAADPVVISLLSDSEAEDSEPAEEESALRNPPPRHGEAGLERPDEGTSADRARREAPSAQASPGGGHDAAGDGVGEQSAPKADRTPCQPTQSATSPEAPSDEPGVTSDKHGMPSERGGQNQPAKSPTKEKPRPEEEGRCEHTDSSSESPIAGGQPGVDQADPMDVDEAPVDETATASRAGQDTQLENELQASLIQEDEPVDEPMEDESGSNEADPAVSESQPTEMEVERGVPSQASDALMRDVDEDESSEARRAERQTTVADVAGAVSEGQQQAGAASMTETQRGTSGPTATEPAAAAEASEPRDSDEGTQQPMTPAQSQHKDNTCRAVPRSEGAPDEDEDEAAEAQIISEYHERQAPTKPSASTADKASAGSKVASPDSSEVIDDDRPKGGQELEVQITVKPRKGRHRRTRSGGNSGRGGAHADPSLVLAKAPTSEGSVPESEKELKPPTRLRVAGTKSDETDPSLRLATDVTHAKDDGSPRTPRAGRSAAVEAERTTPSAVASTPTSASRRQRATPEVTRELRSRAHASPDVGAEAALESPSVAGSMAEDQDAAALKRNLQKSLRTSLADFLPLKSLRESLNKTTDIVAVATLTPPQPHRPKHGPRDYMMELILTDPSTAPTSVIVAHLFRQHQASLPVVQAGDVVLLRRVQVVSVQGRGFGVRVKDESAWAVFEKGDEEMLPQIKGPPVEVTAAEAEHAQGLRRWWAMQDERALAKVDKAAHKASSQAGKNEAK